MEPFPNIAVAVTWEFRCHGKEIPGDPWAWHCRSREGSIVASSKKYFQSLRQAIADARHHGFQYDFDSNVVATGTGAAVSEGNP